MGHDAGLEIFKSKYPYWKWSLWPKIFPWVTMLIPLETFVRLLFYLFCCIVHAINNRLTYHLNSSSPSIWTTKHTNQDMIDWSKPQIGNVNYTPGTAYQTSHKIFRCTSTIWTQQQTNPATYWMIFEPSSKLILPPTGWQTNYFPPWNKLQIDCLSALKILLSFNYSTTIY